MLNILIVEDVIEKLDSMRDYLAYEFPYARVDVAASVQDAIDLIRETSKRGLAYKIAILDFMLPKSKTDPTLEIDVTLRGYLRESTSRDAVVFYITAHPNTPVIQDYLKLEALHSPDGGRPIVISKLGDDFWTDKLYDSIRRVVHGDRISARLQSLFGNAGGPADVTQELDAFLDDAEAHWQFLDAQLRASIERTFHVRRDDEGDGVTINLLR